MASSYNSYKKTKSSYSEFKKSLSDYLNSLNNYLNHHNSCTNHDQKTTQSLAVIKKKCPYLSYTAVEQIKLFYKQHFKRSINTIFYPYSYEKIINLPFVKNLLHKESALFIIYDLENITATKFDEICKHWSNKTLLHNILLIIDQTKLTAKSKKNLKNLLNSKKSIEISTQELKQFELPSLCSDLSRIHNLKISAYSTQLLSSYCDQKPYLIHQILDQIKLITSSSFYRNVNNQTKNHLVSDQLVVNLIEHLPSGVIFRLTDHLINNEKSLAHIVLSELIGQKVPPLVILAILYYHLSQICLLIEKKISQTPTTNRQKPHHSFQTSDQIKIAPFIQKKYAKALTRFNTENLKTATIIISRIDLYLKSKSEISSDLLITTLIEKGL